MQRCSFCAVEVVEMRRVKAASLREVNTDSLCLGSPQHPGKPLVSVYRVERYFVISYFLRLQGTLLQ
jgi:hypothetical protein